MAVRFHELPLDAFGEKARPYIARLNRELRDLFALEAVIAGPVSGARSDGSIVRGQEPQVAVSRITPSVATVASDDPSSSTSVMSTAAFGTDNRVIRSDGTGRDVQVGSITLNDVGSLIPITTNTQDIGTSALKLKDVYVAGVVSIAGGLTLTGAATNTKTYANSVNNLGFISTVPDVAGNNGFDCKDGFTYRKVSGSVWSNLLSIRDSAGTYKFRVRAAASALSGLTKLVIGDGTTASSTLDQTILTVGDDASGLGSAGTSVTATGFSTATGTTMVFLSGGGISLRPDGLSGPSDYFTEVVQVYAWLNVTQNDWMQWDWFTNPGALPTDARRFFKGTIDTAHDVYISKGGRWGNQAARVGYAFDTAQFFTWDLLLGGGLGFIGVGAVEPIT